MFKKISISTLLSLAFSGTTGCVTAKAINGPDGTPHQLITCGDIESCYSKATEVCGGKYKIVHSSSSVYGGGEMMTSSDTSILVKCE